MFKFLHKRNSSVWYHTVCLFSLSFFHAPILMHSIETYLFHPSLSFGPVYIRSAVLRLTVLPSLLRMPIGIMSIKLPKLIKCVCLINIPSLLTIMIWQCVLAVGHVCEWLRLSTHNKRFANCAAWGKGLLVCREVTSHVSLNSGRRQSSFAPYRLNQQCIRFQRLQLTSWYLMN